MYGVLKGRDLEVIPGIPTLDMLQRDVQGDIEAVLIMMSPDRPDVELVVYGNDIGRILGLPVHFARNTDGQQLHGNLVIVANAVTGETVAATQNELTEALSYLTPVEVPA